MELQFYINIVANKQPLRPEAAFLFCYAATFTDEAVRQPLNPENMATIQDYRVLQR
jgi:hypothetical protein